MSDISTAVRAWDECVICPRGGASAEGDHQRANVFFALEIGLRGVDVL